MSIIHPMRVASRSRPAFTLVELLVVIGIIAILLAILLPALQKARYQTQRIHCASNMRQWAIALQLYAANNKGSFPYNLDGNDISWIGSTVQAFATEEIGQDLNGIFSDTIPNGEGDHVMYCPTQQWHRYVRETSVANQAQELVGYFYMPYRETDPASANRANNNYAAAGDAWVAKKKFFNNDAPQAPILSDMIQALGLGGWGGPVPYSSHIERAGNIPSGGNFMFEDGHVEWYNLDSVEVGDYCGGWLMYYKIPLATP